MRPSISYIFLIFILAPCHVDAFQGKTLGLRQTVDASEAAALRQAVDASEAAQLDSFTPDVEFDIRHLPFSTDVLKALRTHRAAMKDPLHSATRVKAIRVKEEMVQLKSNRRWAFGWTNRKPVLWLHIHKAGGSLMCGLAELAGEHIVRPNENCNWKGHDGYFDSGHQERGTSCLFRASFYRLMGFTFGNIERELFDSDMCFGDFDYGVMLREPVSLMRSMMNYHPDKGLAFVEEIEDFLNNGKAPECNCQDEVWKYMDNFQTRVLSRAWDVPPGKMNDTHLAAARELLDKFKVVTRLEDFPTGGAKKTFQTLGWSPDMISHISTKYNPSYTSEYNFTFRQKKWLKELNKYDIALWKGYGPDPNVTHTAQSEHRNVDETSADQDDETSADQDEHEPEQAADEHQVDPYYTPVGDKQKTMINSLKSIFR